MSLSGPRTHRIPYVAADLGDKAGCRGLCAGIMALNVESFFCVTAGLHVLPTRGSTAYGYGPSKAVVIHLSKIGRIGKADDFAGLVLFPVAHVGSNATITDGGSSASGSKGRPRGGRSCEVAGYGAAEAYSYARLRTAMFLGVGSQRARRATTRNPISPRCLPPALLSHWIFK
ncbi:hypothetical protein MAPG_05597 [Magnaporthiopsis poae ATCC 64411]|uniref:Uncharacterized protein n=1 Tax=Magnaporthiopsis poae (strain ATCC 64411 / 73-15) TaxID=644358 RepID=A0A0C4DZU0_MAGP6|nr:hypothetical protein MAPG_05597 [Magnaporthiopsis poae ATCC 64411]